MRIANSRKEPFNFIMKQTEYGDLGAGYYAASTMVYDAVCGNAFVSMTGRPGDWTK
jgi:hypothetical protein